MTLIHQLKSYSINALLVLLSAIAMLLVVEIALRFTKYSSVLNREYSYPSRYFRADKILGYDIGRNIKDKIHRFHGCNYEVFSNKYGCFDYDREIPDKYTLVLGDSMTWGYTPLEKKWTSTLEEESGVFVLKCGVSGFGTAQELIKAKRVVDLVGKKPKYIIILYIGNDLNDDFMFPHRTVINGYLVNSIKHVDLVEGEKNYYSTDELNEKYKKYFEGTISNKLRKLRYNMITYMLYKTAKPQLKAVKKRITRKLKTLWSNHNLIGGNFPNQDSKNAMPKSMTGAYSVSLMKYLDNYDLEWYNRAISEHKNNIKNLKEYSDSMGAKFILIDNGFLQHPRFDDVRKHLGQSYYNLSDDYKKQSKWKYDGHWNIEGNQQAGQHIYNHLKKIDFF